MKIRFAMLALCLAIAASPAAAWKLVSHGKPVLVAKRITVTAPDDWNRITTGYVSGSELWTLDGIRLNELYFVAGLMPGKPIFVELDRKDHPLPKFSASMQLTDLPGMFESTWRVARKANVFTTGAIEPAKLGGHDAIKFGYEYSAEGSQLTYRGIATAAIIDRQLFLIEFEAPALHYFERDQAKAEAVMSSATVLPMPSPGTVRK
jgi:hypothetical protein